MSANLDEHDVHDAMLEHELIQAERFIQREQKEAGKRPS